MKNLGFFLIFIIIILLIFFIYILVHIHKSFIYIDNMYMHIYMYIYSFSGGSNSKEAACNSEDPGLIPRLERSPDGGHGNPLQYSCLKNSMDSGAWRATYNPWGPKELDTTEQLTHKYTYVCVCMYTHIYGYIYQKKNYNIIEYVPSQQY